MRRFLIGAFGLGLTAAAGAQQNADFPPVQPPPDLDTSVPASAAQRSAVPVVPLANSDEEARSAAAAAASASAERARALANPTLPASPVNPNAEPGRPLTSPGLPPEVQRAAEATELPVVTVRQNGNERVEEYRKKGVLYFVRVVPQEGPTRYYVDNRTDVPPDIRQLSAPSGHVEPVYYRLLDWK